MSDDAQKTTDLPASWRCWCGHVRLAGRPYCEHHAPPQRRALTREEEIEAMVNFVLDTSFGGP